MTPLLSNAAIFFLSAIGLGLTCGLYLFFIAASFGLVRSRVITLQEMEQEGVRGAAHAIRVVEQADKFLLCAQFGRVLTSIAVGVLVTILAWVVRRAFLAAGLCESQTSMFVVVGVVYFLCALVMLVLVQVAKALALQHPEKVICLGALPLRFYCYVWGPILLCVHQVVNKVIGRWGIRMLHERELVISSAELEEIVKSSSAAGGLEHEERQILERVAKLSDRVARDVMTPRKDIVWIRDSAPTRDVIALCRKESVSRVLVCGSDLDDVRGVLLVKDFLAFVGESCEEHSWKKFIRPVYRIPDTKEVQKLLAELRQKQVHFSVVLNEHGEVVGVITLEDLVEQIVGDILDEFDKPSSERSVATRGDGELIVDGAMPVTELHERHYVNLPEGEYQTVGGFVHDQLGRVPTQGDSFSFAGLTISVLEVQKHRVVRLSIRRAAPAQVAASVAENS